MDAVSLNGFTFSIPSPAWSAQVRGLSFCFMRCSPQLPPLIPTTGGHLPGITGVRERPLQWSLCFGIADFTFYIFVFCAIPRGAQFLLQGLRSGITPGHVWGTIDGARDGICVDYIQGKTLPVILFLQP